MGRNAELIRQWSILQKLARARGNTIPKLAREFGRNPRTIRRDLEALQVAGFPIYDEEVNGTKFWKLDPTVMGSLARTGLTFSELCALYFSRALLDCFAGSHMATDLESALNKIQAAVSPAMRKFLNKLPQAVVAKAPRARQGIETYRVTGQLFDAILEQRVVSMRYFSFESGAEKQYVLHPYRLVPAQNTLYLEAFVPAYAEMRTFAVDRIRRVSLEKTTFERVVELSSSPFRNSMGVHRGPTTKVQLRFHKRLAPLIKERSWHASQQLKDRADGTVVMTLDVSDDYALRNWILGFGRYVRVVAPATLAEWVQDELQAARDQYASGTVRLDSTTQPPLPFLFSRVAE